MGRKAGNSLISGIGFNDGKHSMSIGGKVLKEYSLWQDMLLRCTEKYWEKKPTYVGTTCSENFKSYSYFYEWCQSQVGFKNKEEDGVRVSWHLDKDLLSKSNKLYSEDTCVFLPKTINLLLTKRDKSRGKYPLGVSWHSPMKKLRAKCCVGGGVQQLIGYYDTPEQAFLAYKTFKETYIKQVAEQYKDVIDPRAYKALLEYEVNIDD